MAVSTVALCSRRAKANLLVVDRHEQVEPPFGSLHLRDEREPDEDRLACPAMHDGILKNIEYRLFEHRRIGGHHG